MQETQETTTAMQPQESIMKCGVSKGLVNIEEKTRRVHAIYNLGGSERFSEFITLRSPSFMVHNRRIIVRETAHRVQDGMFLGYVYSQEHTINQSDMCTSKKDLVLKHYLEEIPPDRLIIDSKVLAG